MLGTVTSPVNVAGLRERFRLPRRGRKGRVVVPAAKIKNVSSSLLPATTVSPRISTDARGRKRRLVSTTPTIATRMPRDGELVTPRIASFPPPGTTSASEILSSAFIPLSFRKLEELAVDLMSPAPRGTTLDFVRIVRTLFHLECFGARDRMKHYVYYHASPNDRLGYEQFDLNDLQVTSALEDSVAVHRANQDQLMTREEFDALSSDFVADFCALLQEAYYSPLTQKEWDLARAEQFMFTLPCEIKWNNLDDELMKDFLRRNPKLRSVWPEQFNDSLALFHRGYGVARAKGGAVAPSIRTRGHTRARARTYLLDSRRTLH